MADFRAKIIADADLRNATSAIESFIKQARKLKVDVDLNLTNAGQNLTGILEQYLILRILKSSMLKAIFLINNWQRKFLLNAKAKMQLLMKLNLLIQKPNLLYHSI